MEGTRCSTRGRSVCIKGRRWLPPWCGCCPTPSQAQPLTHHSPASRTRGICRLWLHPLHPPHPPFFPRSPPIPFCPPVPRFSPPPDPLAHYHTPWTTVDEVTLLGRAPPPSLLPSSPHRRHVFEQAPRERRQPARIRWRLVARDVRRRRGCLASGLTWSICRGGARHRRPLGRLRPLATAAAAGRLHHCGLVP